MEEFKNIIFGYREVKNGLPNKSEEGCKSSTITQRLYTLGLCSVAVPFMSSGSLG